MNFGCDVLDMHQHYYRFRFAKIKYYIIRREGSGAGLFSLVNTALGHIDYAIKHNYIPVIDMKNYYNCYLEDDEIGVVNSWERLFDQPLDIGLDEAYNGRCVILSEGCPISPRPDDDMEFFNNINGRLDYWNSLAHKYIRVRKDILNEIEVERSSLFSSSDKTLGVLARGTDYLSLKPFGHPVQPEPQQILEKVKAVFEEGKYTKIFLATEDKSIQGLFEEAFGDIVVSNKREYVDYVEGQSVTKSSINRDNDRFLRGKEYLTTILILSKCDGIIAGRTSGTVGAFLLSDGYDYSYVYDLGRYGE